MLQTKTATIKLTSLNIEHYRQKGYDVSKKEIEVNVFDLKSNCTTYVKIQCDYCKEVFQRRWSDYIKSLHDDFKKDACPKCSGKRVAEYKKIKYGTSNPETISKNLTKDKLFKRKPYSEIKEIYESYGCKLLLSEEEYNSTKGELTHIIAPYICTCGRKQDGRSIDYFIKKYQLCEVCAKEKRRQDDAFKYHNDYESVKQKMLSEDKELLTDKEYFVKNDDIEYRCMICGTITKIKYYTYIDPKHNHVCSGCRTAKKRKEQWQRICDVAEESGLNVITTSEEFMECDDIPFNEKRITFECYCTNEFVALVGEFLYAGKRQCNTCGIKSRSGEFAPRWKGGVTSELEKIRHSKEYIEWRNSVYSRDNYTCLCCGDDSGGNLRAHHVKNFSDNEELRFVTSNGITLCDQCHNPSKIGSFHCIYGTKNNNVDQLKEYISKRREELKLPPIDIDEILQDELDYFK